MRCPARFMAATALAGVSIVPLSVASNTDGTRAVLTATKPTLESKEGRP